MKIPPSIRARLLFALTASSLCLTSSSLAQSTVTPAKKEDEIQQLTPFEVSAAKSKGTYVQEEVVSVTKFAVPIINVPQNVFVFTREFMDDLNFGQMRAMLAYNASLQGGLNSVGGSYRGFSNQEKLRDGFKMSAFFDYDPVHFERIELLKGPSAVMYGRTEPGGITNYVTKTPVPGANFANFTIGTGKIYHNTRRNFMADINQSLPVTGGNGNLDLRLTAAYREYQDGVDSITENGGQKQASVRLAATYWLTKNTRLYLSYMHYYRLFESQFGRYASFAVGVPQATPGLTIPFSILYGRDPFEDYGYGRNFYWQFNDTEAILDHKFSSTLSFRAGFHMHKRTNEDYLLLIAPTTVAGQGAIAQTNINKNKDDVYLPDFQAHIAWKPGADQNVLVGVNRNIQFLDQKQWNQQRNPDGTPFRRTYIPSQGIPHALPGDVAYIATAVNRNRTYYDAAQINYLGGFLEEKLHLMAGVAYNKVKIEFKPSSLRPSPPPTLQTTDTNPQLGVIYKVTPEWSAFILGSQSSQYTTTQDSFGKYFGPILGTGYEGGFKFAIGQGRFNGTITYYNTEQQNNVVFDPLAKSFLYQQTVTAGTPNPALLGDNVAAGTTASKGVEFEINGSVTPDWGVTFSYAHNDQIFKKNPLAVVQGTKVGGTEPNRMTMYNRFNFDRMGAKGLYTGLGIIYIDKIYGGFSPGSNNTKTYWAKGGLRLDAMVGYRFQWLGRGNEIKFQAINANGPETFRSGFDPARNAPYAYLKAKPSLNFDYTIRF